MLDRHATWTVASRPDLAPKLPKMPKSGELNKGLEVFLSNAQLLMDGGELQLARDLIAPVLKANPADPVAVRILADSFRLSGQMTLAHRCYLQLAHLEPNFRNLYSLGQSLYTLERHEEAKDCYLQALAVSRRLEPEMFHIYKNLGNIHVHNGDYESAEENYHRAFALSPDSDALHVNLATLAIQQDDFNAALVRFRIAVRLNPNCDKGWVGLAIVHRHFGDHDLSWANINRALDANPGNPTALRFLVDWAFADLRLDAALGRLQDYLSIHFDDAFFAFILAKIYAEQTRWSMALIELERVLAIDPSFEAALDLFERVQGEKRKLKEAEQYA